MSDSTLIPFNFGAVEVRASLDELGNTWFIASDVCKVLEIKNAPHALKGLDDDEKMTIANGDSHSGKRGGAQSLNIINESGLYKLIFRSRKPQAEAFTKWVTNEVLPAIRKTGGYSSEPKPSFSADVIALTTLLIELSKTPAGSGEGRFWMKSSEIPYV